jgi:predicted nucleic acid-binding Zn ribbon protein
MRKSQTQKISEVISECLSELNIDRKLKEFQLVSQWEQLMGKTVASRTRQLYIRHRILYIHVTSAVLKSELLMMRQAIIARLNEEAGEKLVDQVVIR